MPDKLKLNELEQQTQMNRSLFDVVLSFILNMSKTRANYWGEFAIDIPLGIVLIFAGLRHHDLSLLVVFLTVVLGVVLFSFFEYFIHRWLFHGSVRDNGGRSSGTPLESDGLRFPAVLPARNGAGDTDRHICIADAHGTSISAHRNDNFRLCHLRSEPLLHSPYSFSKVVGQTLVSSSSHSSPSHRF